MKFDTYFKLTSYIVVACGVLALLASGGVDIFVTVLFVAAMAGAWRCENSKWQVSERMGLMLIVLALPLFYLDWQYQSGILSRERAGAATLAHLIMGLSVIKLFQVKNDRDWVFLYLISFFEVLLAAGLSISPTFLASLVVYLLCMLCTIIAFEIRKAERGVKIIELSLPESAAPRRLLWRLPVAATAILITISFIAIPLFFMMPRVGGAGIGNGGGVTGFVGFSDSVTLGSIGRLQQNDQVVMRIRIDESTAAIDDLRWRGMALDTFDNKGWRRNQEGMRTPFTKDQNGSFKFGTVDKVSDLTVQTVYLEPIDTNVIFGAPRIIAVQGGFPLMHRDTNETVTRPQSGDRVVYKVYSDTSTLDEKSLRTDKKPYSEKEREIYLQLPKQPLDERIPALAQNIIQQSGAKNRYDEARAVERYLQTQYGYTLDLRAGGDQPLADFLFNVREGHCEYFATAMAVMLRTQGVATRVVNGFQSGEYNDAANAYIVTQKQAHSWVEVYFPENEKWVTFDPTPAAGRNLPGASAVSFFPQVGKYFEAFQMFWLQYVVAYDNQEQRSLARSFREQLVQNHERASTFSQVIREQIKEWWNKLSGVRGAETRFYTIAQSILAIVLLIAFGGALWFVSRRVSLPRIWALLQFEPQNDSRRIIEFYERMTAALAKQGKKREASQTPLEFAAAIGAAEAFKITEAYNRVRFGEQHLSAAEYSEVENWLKTLERV